MPKETRPSMPFYGRDWYDDINVQEMDYSDQGMYFKLCWLCWTETSIPDDGARIARLLKVDPTRFVEQSFARLRACFEAVDGQLIHPKVEKIRAEADEFAARRSQQGKAGAEARWGRSRSQPLLSGPEDDQNGMPKQCPGNAPASATHMQRIPNAYATHDAPHMQTPCEGDAKTWPASASASAIALEDISSAGRFKEFWEMYPEARRGVIALSYGSYESLIKTLAQHNDLVDGLKGWLGSEQWGRSLREDGGSFIPYADKFIEKGRYLEKPPKAKKSSLAAAAERAKALDIQK